MVFISLQLPLAEFELKTPKEILVITEWLLFDINIKNKNYLKDENLNAMYYRLKQYPIFYKERIYNYLMSDNYYFNSQLHKTINNLVNNCSQIICMNKVKELYEITDHETYKKEIVKQEDRLFREENIEDMFTYFERNNFRENPVCEYVLG